MVKRRKSERKNAYKSQLLIPLRKRKRITRNENGAALQTLKSIISLNISMFHEDFPHFHPSLWGALPKADQQFLYSREG